MASAARSRPIRSVFWCSLSAITIAACGGATDIDFTGDGDGGISGSGNGAQGGVGAQGGDAGIGGVGGDVGGVGGQGGVPTGGASGFGGTAAVGGTAGSQTGGAAGAGGVVCGGVPCQPVQTPIGPADPCCAGDKCGVTISLLGNECIELNQPGKPDPSCPDQNVQGFQLDGCCKPNGFCGVNDTFIGFGCFDPSQFTGQPPIACGGGTGGAGGTGGSGGTGGMGGTGGVGQPGEKTCGITNPDTCSPNENCCFVDPGLDYCSGAPCNCNTPGCDVTTVSCDGPEDCPGNQLCCGTYSFQQQQYTTLSCKATCGAPNEREICHPGGQPCANPNQTCSNSPSLPSYLFRCD